MNKIAFVLGLAASLAVGHAQLVITEVMSNSAHPGGTNNGDWFELSNAGPTAFSLVGWTWDDSSATAGSANFGALTSIAAGASVIISQETIGQEASWISNWGVSGVSVVNLGSGAGGFQDLSISGDQVNLYDASNALAVSLTFGTSPAGSSFAWTTTGVPLGSSVNGVNGAFVALSNGAAAAGVDVGSPGIAVPEPAPLALILGGAAWIALLGGRRRPVAQDSGAAACCRFQSFVTRKTCGQPFRPPERSPERLFPGRARFGG